MKRIANKSSHGAARHYGLLVFVIMLFVGLFPARAQIRIFFPVGDATLHPEYLSNIKAFASLDSLIANPPGDLDSLVVVSKAEEIRAVKDLLVELDPDYTVPMDPIPVDTDFYVEPLRTQRMLLALKTNLLFDLATALNFEIEVPIGKRWSIMAEDVFPWWESGNKYCLQMWEIGLEGRYWFRPWNPQGINKLRGWFAGVYGMSSKYDLQFDRDIDYQGEYWSTGLTGGYSTPLGRKKWGNLEFSLGLGYLRSEYRHYQPMESYSNLIRDPFDVGTVHYFGLTKAKISLVIPIKVLNPIPQKEVHYE